MPVEAALTSLLLTFEKRLFTRHVYAAEQLTTIINPINYIVRKLSMIPD